MAVQYNASEVPNTVGAGIEYPHPVSLETIEVIEQVLAQMLSSLRRRVTSSEFPDAGAIEYESWRAH
jgi:hypothetical protein